MSLLLVAEQDEDGGVACVWQWQPGDRFPKALQDRSEVANDLAQAEVYSASREEVFAWIDRELVVGVT